MTRLWLLLLCLLPLGLRAQLDNSAFFRKPSLGQAYERGLYVGLQSLSYNKNNEYFGPFADGVTYFGQQITPTLAFFPDSSLRLDAGAFLQREFGDPGLSRAKPFFAFTYQKRNFRLVFGNLEAHLNHRLLEPLFDFERVLTDRTENGLQVFYRQGRWQSETWLDWRRAIFDFSAFPERLWAGHTSRIRLWETEGDFLELPLQGTLYHQGGQIDTTDASLLTRVNASAGLRYHRRLGGDSAFWQGFELEPHILAWNDFIDQTLPVDQGFGFYLNGTLLSRYGRLMLSYWWAKDWYSPLGGELYRSVPGSIFAKPQDFRQRRHLLFFRYLFDQKIAQGLTLSFRLQPYWDIEEGLLEFSTGIYLNYRGLFRLAELPRKALLNY